MTTLLLALALVAEPTEIDPGAAAGAIRLGDRREAVHQLLGKPTWAYGSRSKRVEVFRKRPPTTPPTFFRIIFHGEVVEQILVGYFGSWVTKEGLSGTTPIETWLAPPRRWKLTVYAQEFGTGAGRAACYFDDVQRGLALVVYENAGPDRLRRPVNLGAVIVHRPGVRAVPEHDLVPAPEIAAVCPKSRER